MTAAEYMLIIIGLIACIYIYHTSEYSQLKCIISNVDGNKYCVRERDKLELAADRLANVNMRMKKVVEHCGSSYKNQDNVKRLVKGYNPKKYMRRCRQVNTPHIAKIKERNWRFV